MRGLTVSRIDSTSSHILPNTVISKSTDIRSFLFCSRFLFVLTNGLRKGPRKSFELVSIKRFSKAQYSSYGLSYRVQYPSCRDYVCVFRGGGRGKIFLQSRHFTVSRFISYICHRVPEVQACVQESFLLCRLLSLISLE